MGTGTLAPVTETEMAGVIRTMLELGFGGLDLTTGPPAAGFEMLTLATRQRFRVTITEIADR